MFKATMPNAPAGGPEMLRILRENVFVNERIREELRGIKSFNT